MTKTQLLKRSSETTLNLSLPQMIKMIVWQNAFTISETRRLLMKMNLSFTTLKRKSRIFNQTINLPYSKTHNLTKVINGFSIQTKNMILVNDLKQRQELYLNDKERRLKTFKDEHPLVRLKMKYLSITITNEKSKS